MRNGSKESVSNKLLSVGAWWHDPRLGGVLECWGKGVLLRQRNIMRLIFYSLEMDKE